MGQNPGQIRKALDVRLWSHPYPATALPTQPQDHAWNPAEHGFTDLGMTALGSPPSMTNEPTVSDVMAHQSEAAVRSDVTGVSRALTFVLLQTNALTLTTAFGGGTTTVAGGGTLYLPPDLGDTAEWTFILEVLDGTYRELNPFARCRAQLSSGVTFPRDGEDPTRYEISATILQPGPDAPDVPVGANGQPKPWWKIATGDLTTDGGS